MNPRKRKLFLRLKAQKEKETFKTESVELQKEEEIKELEPVLEEVKEVVKPKKKPKGV